MSEIADESGISKALLSHYFTNKLELYMFLWNRSIEQIHKASSQYCVVDTTDFFEILHRSLLAKWSVVRSYPYLYQFATNAYYEQDPKIKSSIQANFQEILWTSDGYFRQMILWES